SCSQVGFRNPFVRVLARISPDLRIGQNLTDDSPHSRGQISFKFDPAPHETYRTTASHFCGVRTWGLRCGRSCLAVTLYLAARWSGSMLPHFMQCRSVAGLFSPQW